MRKVSEIIRRGCNQVRVIPDERSVRVFAVAATVQFISG